jgi:hypothetical protein
MRCSPTHGSSRYPGLVNGRRHLLPAAIALAAVYVSFRGSIPPALSDLALIVVCVGVVVLAAVGLSGYEFRSRRP